ncbi:glutathionylspermidine synthase family protein [Azospirillum sp. YIM B02556]|uniref:Glutathionylspermidine synthase family protein n=1 Tax=Azospirillum endophyticum TaxID=2800326 RepID=A0ABS1F0V9_9PROT|nr:glutathionylspermidine synthase family protein [Azospirillum endophyticum]MBK1837042.1 glutathionylspermidine synthase family protein [Azospirillum endophyticum]
MERVRTSPRPHWQAKLEEIGFPFHTEADGTAYWDESAHWRFSHAEIETLEAAAEEVYRLCEEAVGHVVTRGLYEAVGIPRWAAPAIEASWAERDGRDMALYARFDFAWDGKGGTPKALELNAETPTSLYETAVAQWCWLQDTHPQADQFNSLEEALVERWQARKQAFPALVSQEEAVHFACLMPHPEDEATIAYLQTLALRAGMTTKAMPIQAIRYDDASQRFLDDAGLPIRHLMKLYPWDWMIRETTGRELVAAAAQGRIRMIEPAWKMVMASKGLFALLWELNPGHPNLLHTALDRTGFPAGSMVVAKPLLGREGSNVSIATLDAAGFPVGQPIAQTEGPYVDEGWVYQAFTPLAEADGNHAVFGVWMAGDKACGMGIREDRALITGNTSRFVPHMIAPG